LKDIIVCPAVKSQGKESAIPHSGGQTPEVGIKGITLKGKSVTKEKKVRIVFMGFGGRGSGFIDKLRWLNLWGHGVSCAGVYDISEESARRSMKRLGEEYPFYRDADELFQKEKPDACIIGSFESAHFENYKVAAKYDVPVMVEKPLTASLEDAHEFLRIAKKSKAPVLMAHNMRFAPIIRRAKELIDGGLVGTIHSTRFHNNVHYGSGYFRSWMRLRKNVGSLFCEKATHDLDIMNYLTASYPVKIYAPSQKDTNTGATPRTIFAAAIVRRSSTAPRAC